MRLAMNKRNLHFQTVPLSVVQKVAMLESENTMKKSSGAAREFAKETVQKTEPYSVRPLLTNNKNEQAVGLEIRDGLLLLHRQ
jgi:hypothetical protein